MPDRYGRQDALAAFRRLANASGHEYRYSGQGSTADPAGFWWLDYEPTYGGYVVVECHVTPDGGRGEHHPLGAGRRTARDFYYAVDFALDVLYAADNAYGQPLEMARRGQRALRAAANQAAAQVTP